MLEVCLVTRREMQSAAFLLNVSSGAGKVAYSCASTNVRIYNKSDVVLFIISLYDCLEVAKHSECSSSPSPSRGKSLADCVSAATQLFLLSEMREGEDLHSHGLWSEWVLKLCPGSRVDQWAGVVVIIMWVAWSMSWVFGLDYPLQWRVSCGGNGAAWWKV